MFHATVHAVLAPETECDDSQQQQFNTSIPALHNGTTLCRAKSVVVWWVARNMTCSGVARWTVLKTAPQENENMCLITSPGLNYGNVPYTIGKNGLQFWNQHQNLYRNDSYFSNIITHAQWCYWWRN
jgi:hypothetical protein